MSSKNSGTYVHWLGEGQQPNEKTGTQVFPAPPGASERGAAIPAVGQATPDSVPPVATRTPTVVSPRPVRKATPIREVNQATRIFVVSPPPAAVHDAKRSGEARPMPQPPTAPLLRAFEDARPRAATWSTAKTVAASVAQIEQAERAAKAPVPPVPRAEPKPSRRPSPQGLLGQLRQTSVATQKLCAFVLAAAAVVGLGTLVARSTAPGTVPGGTESAPAVPVATLAHVQPRAAVEAPTPPPSSASSDWSPPLGDGAAPTPAAKHAPAGTAAHTRPLRAPDGSTSNPVTLARQAVDALLAGDRPKALQHYRELSRAEPEREVYRDAVRVLARSASDLQGSP